jgi:hypothetical protein
MNLFKRKVETILLDSGEIYRWKKDIILQALERSAFIVPGALFEEGRTINDLMEISDDETEIVPITERSELKENTYPDIGVILNAGVTMKLNRNCEVIHIHLKGEEKRKKKFIIKTNVG